MDIIKFCCLAGLLVFFRNVDRSLAQYAFNSSAHRQAKFRARMDAINAWEIEIFILWKVHAKDFYSRLEAICCVPL